MANTWWSTYLDPSNCGRGANILAALFLSAFHTCLFVIFTFARIYAAVLRDIEFLNVLSTALKGNNLTIRASACSFYIFTLLKVNLILLTVKPYSTFLYNAKHLLPAVYEIWHSIRQLKITSKVCNKTVIIYFVQSFYKWSNALWAEF